MPVTPNDSAIPFLYADINGMAGWKKRETRPYAATAQALGFDIRQRRRE